MKWGPFFAAAFIGAGSLFTAFMSGGKYSLHLQHTYGSDLSWIFIAIWTLVLACISSGIMWETAASHAKESICPTVPNGETVRVIASYHVPIDMGGNMNLVIVALFDDGRSTTIGEDDFVKPSIAPTIETGTALLKTKKGFIVRPIEVQT